MSSAVEASVLEPSAVVSEDATAAEEVPAGVAMVAVMITEPEASVIVTNDASTPTRAAINAASAVVSV